jgi:hypothetical protein
MIIEVLSSTVTTVPTAKGSYQVCELAFKNKTFQDKVEGKKIMSFAEKEAFTALSSAPMGSVFTVTRIKDEKGYWKWNTVTAGSNPGAAAPAAATQSTGAAMTNASPKSTYETADERAARQVMIVRQSSISNSIALLKTEKHTPTTEEVLAVAKQFENFVFGKSNDLFADLDEDIPL